MHRRHPLATGTAALLALLLAACSNNDDSPAQGTATTQAPVDAEAIDEDQAAVPTAEDLADVDHDDPQAVAAAWGCAYWAHPRGETPEQLAQRLAPLSTPDLQDALAQLRLSDLGRLTIEVAAGRTDPADQADAWTVRCHTITTGPDAAPTAAPTPVAITVHLTDTPDGWRADQATLPDSGLTIP